MGKERNGLTRRQLVVLVALSAAPILLLSTTHSLAGIAQVDGTIHQQSDRFAKALITHSDQPASAQMYLPDPAQNTAGVDHEPAIPEITIPQLPGQTIATSASPKDGVNAIPLPPAVQSGLTGLAALGMAGGLRRLRRMFR